MNIKEKAQQHGLTYYETVGGGQYPKEACQYVETERAHGPRGECYDYALFDKEGDLIALGVEEGNYAGGIIASKDGIEEWHKIENRGPDKEYTYPKGLRNFLKDL